jgi:hypothetical protein
MMQVAPDRDLPRDVDEAVGGPEESARNVICAGRQALAQGVDQVAIRNGGHCHAKVELCSPSGTTYKSVH